MAVSSLDSLQRLAQEALKNPRFVRIVLEAQTCNQALRTAERAGIRGREKVAVGALAKLHRDHVTEFYRILERAGVTPA